MCEAPVGENFPPAIPCPLPLWLRDHYLVSGANSKCPPPVGRPPPYWIRNKPHSPLPVQVLNVNVPNSDPAKGPGPSSFAITCPGIINYVGEHHAVHRASYSESYTCLPSPPQHMCVFLIVCCLCTGDTLVQKDPGSNVFYLSGQPAYANIPGSDCVAGACVRMPQATAMLCSCNLPLRAYDSGAVWHGIIAVTPLTVRLPHLPVPEGAITLTNAPLSNQTPDSPAGAPHAAV